MQIERYQATRAVTNRASLKFIQIVSHNVALSKPQSLFGSMDIDGLRLKLNQRECPPFTGRASLLSAGPEGRAVRSWPVSNSTILSDITVQCLHSWRHCCHGATPFGVSCAVDAKILSAPERAPMPSSPRLGCLRERPRQGLYPRVGGRLARILLRNAHTGLARLREPRNRKTALGFRAVDADEVAAGRKRACTDNLDKPQTRRPRGEPDPHAIGAPHRGAPAIGSLCSALAPALVA